MIMQMHKKQMIFIFMMCASNPVSVNHVWLHNVKGKESEKRLKIINLNQVLTISASDPHREFMLSDLCTAIPDKWAWDPKMNNDIKSVFTDKELP